MESLPSTCPRMGSMRTTLILSAPEFADISGLIDQSTVDQSQIQLGPQRSCYGRHVRITTSHALICEKPLLAGLRSGAT